MVKIVAFSGLEDDGFIKMFKTRGFPKLKPITTYYSQEAGIDWETYFPEIEIREKEEWD